MRGSPRAGVRGATVATLMPAWAPPRPLSEGMSRNCPERNGAAWRSRPGRVHPGGQRGGDRLGDGGTAGHRDGVGVPHQ